MKYFIMAALLATVACSSKKEVAPAAVVLPKTLEESVSSSFRTQEFTKRDMYRHPLETLKFFGVTPEMNVVEISPSAGWYTEILAPFLAEKGHYVAATPVAEKPYQIENEAKLKAFMAKYPQVSSKMETAMFNPPSEIKLPADGSADMVLTFRNVHNWMTVKSEKAAFKAFFKVLKPGGILGVVEHRANPDQKESIAKSGYVRQQDVVKMARDAGFRLVAASEINANPKDTKDYPEGVWTLPPVLRLGDVDKDKYLAIGESDRMTLKFMKPRQ